MPPDAPALLIAGAACRYPEASSPAELLRNSLEGRRAFRAIPPERLVVQDYHRSLIGEADSITPILAGLLVDWHFDAARFRIPRSVVDSTDLAHWLALEVAADAVEAAGGLDRLDPARTAVVVANTLTGEFSRAAQLRLRWPWLDQLLHRSLANAGIEERAAAAARLAFRNGLRSVFRDPDEDTLAGGLANTIAGRIANYFDLHGGAFSVDAACASSLIAITTAADLLVAGRADAVLVAAVDLSLDPFELVGFSRNGALAEHAMRVFDARAEGFWPGEGAGAVLLVNRDAYPHRLTGEVQLTGWGMSTDGSGGLTRPTEAGQRLAIQRALVSAKTEPDEVGYVEAHGTGTAVGDPVEVRALASAFRDRQQPLPIASIKGNIGHTKAAAGLAGLIRTIEAMKAGVLPPHTCERPHPVFGETGHRLRLAAEPEEWSQGRRVAGVSSFGFGGVNAHVVLAAPASPRPAVVPKVVPVRDESLFLFRGDEASVVGQLRRLRELAPHLSLAEVADAAADAAARLEKGGVSLAFRATSGETLAAALDRAGAALAREEVPGIHIGRHCRPPRLALVFPGQAAPVRTTADAWGRRFPGSRQPFRPEGKLTDTAAAQPCVVTACLAGLELIEACGVQAEAALGHSLGELVALAWGGSIPRDELIDLARERGSVMSAMPPGQMLRVECGPADVAGMVEGLPIAIACLNSVGETVLSGDDAAIAAFEQRVAKAGLAASRLPVSHAFHSPMMAPAGQLLAERWRNRAFAAPERTIVSTVTGDVLPDTVDVVALLVRQLTQPVLFDRAVAALAERVDAFVEVGPGTGLSRLLAQRGIATVSIDTFSESIAPLLDAIGALFAMGIDLNPEPLFGTTGLRPLRERPPCLLVSPCGRPTDLKSAPPVEPGTGPETEEEPTPLTPNDGDPLERLIALVSEETGLPPSAISPEDRFLSDLHLNSLAVSRLVRRAASAPGPASAPFATAFSDGTIREAAEAIEELAQFADVPRAAERVEGVAPWIRSFRPLLHPMPRRPRSPVSVHRTPVAAASLGPADILAIELDGGWDAVRDSWALTSLCQEAAGRYAHLAIFHAGAPLSGFARSLVLEGLFAGVQLIEGHFDPSLLAAADGFEEICRLPNGCLATPALALAETFVSQQLTHAGSLCVTGGARGIAAECAFRLAERLRAPLILVGRAPADQPEVASTLARLAAIGVAARYVRADVADRDTLAAGVAAAAADLGAVTHLVHAAGANAPARFLDLDRETLRATLAAKVEGLDAAVAACGASLRRVIAFGSIIARFGLAGEAHYALANGELARRLGTVVAARPELSGLTLEWSVWSGAGMGERLGVLERLSSAGVDPLRLDDALELFESLALSSAQGNLVVTSRFGSDPAPLEPALRFMQKVLVHTPEVELVAEAQLRPGRDPYLEDHAIDGERIVPAVLLIEAMAQAANALQKVEPTVQDLRLIRAIDAQDGATLRIAVLKDPDNVVRAEIRSAEDRYAEPFATARFVPLRTRRPPAAAESDPLMDAAPLYGPLFFHGEAFRRIALIGDVSSRSISATFTAPVPRSWFGRFEPQTLLFGDPGIRDAALHVLQCCVPHRRLVPIGAQQIARWRGGAAVRMYARERWSRGNDYCFEISLIDAEGRVVERWRDALFHAIGSIDPGPVLVAAPELTATYLERRAREALGDDSLAVRLVDDVAATREERRNRAALALGLVTPPLRRGDGRPLAAGSGRSISFSHSDGVTLAVSAALRVGCDIERIEAFSGQEAAVSWTAEETLRKIGSIARLRRRADGLFTGDAAEMIVALAPVRLDSTGCLAVAIGAAPL
ncbi:MAG: enediyne polyketide synthase [Sphingomonadales bacterium]|jgi:enediyne polyketide synthase|nr:enediyne polyketide synthase [Sphingomonadales bacterium]